MCNKCDKLKSIVVADILTLYYPLFSLRQMDEAPQPIHFRDMEGKQVVYPQHRRYA